MSDDGTSRGRLLREANDLIHGERNQTYGSPTENFTRIAELWTTLLRAQLKPGERVTPRQVADLMIALKLARSVTQPKRDNYVDVAGYAALGWEAEESTQPSVRSVANPQRTSVGRSSSWIEIDDPYDASTA